MLKRQGFTLIELVMVILILGILSAVAIPIFTDYTSQAKESAEKGVVGGVRAGIMTAYLRSTATPKVFPTALDDCSAGPCSTSCTATSTGCFDDVLTQGGITDVDWVKGAAGLYTGPNSGAYTYDNTDGSFN